MARQIPNDYTSYELTPEEEELGSVLNPEQTMVLRNKLSIIAADKLRLEVDTTNIQQFVQQEAYLRGQLDVINWLLDSSEAVVAEKLADLKRQQESEQQSNNQQ